MSPNGSSHRVRQTQASSQTNTALVPPSAFPPSAEWCNRQYVDLRPGDRVDRYTLIRPLGEGGQGAVWQVVDPLDEGATRALKLVHLSEAGQAAFARARREAKILAALDHPGLCACHALFEDLDKGLVGVVLDLVQGSTLDAAMHDRRMSKGHRFAALVQVVDVLAYVHAAGLAHRDLKPANVLVTDAFWETPHQPGAVKVIDFGIAVPIGNPQRLTAVGGVIGTVRYLAPELFRPSPSRRAAAEESCARDMFAFGIIAWELLWGTHPAGLGPSASFEAMAQRYADIEAGRRPWPSPSLSGPWGTAIAACLSLGPEDRPEHGAALASVLKTGAPPPSRRAPSGALPSRTEPHAPAPAPFVPRTEPMAPAARTAPMPAPRHSSAPVRRDEPSGRGARGAMYALAGAIALLAGAIYLKPPGKFAADDVPLLSLPTPNPSGTALVPSSSPPKTVEQNRAGVCCGGLACNTTKQDTRGTWCEKKPEQCAKCSSGRPYVPGRCAEMLPLDRPFLLRLAHLNGGQADLSVCFRRADDPRSEEQCIAAADGADPSRDGGIARERRLSVTAGQLSHKPGLEITIKDSRGETVAHGNHIFHPKGLLTSALCVGTEFRIGDRQIPVAFYLDDPSP
ncbi:protein kinase domain-containing protein [Polyangium sorediatum]|uniref:Protein kinase n=1 Tax=Polyangium sorediatum TaxID=889274 RepID=A0ABT6NJU9_9BACT|nr:protein kinase [Polyangium sorediatum]MDI1428525.1 protein kinase [Polyangium sorediatum]